MAAWPLRQSSYLPAWSLTLRRPCIHTAPGRPGHGENDLRRQGYAKRREELRQAREYLDAQRAQLAKNVHMLDDNRCGLAPGGARGKVARCALMRARAPAASSGRGAPSDLVRQARTVLNERRWQLMYRLQEVYEIRPVTRPVGWSPVAGTARTRNNEADRRVARSGCGTVPATTDAVRDAAAVLDLRHPAAQLGVYRSGTAVARSWAFGGAPR